MAVSFIERFNLYTGFLSPEGKDELLGAIATWRQKYGDAWLDEFRTAAPAVADFIDLCANYTFDGAWVELNSRADEWIKDESNAILRDVYSSMKTVTLEGVKPKLEVLHAAVRREIDRPRV